MAGHQRQNLFSTESNLNEKNGDEILVTDIQDCNSNEKSGDEISVNDIQGVSWFDCEDSPASSCGTLLSHDSRDQEGVGDEDHQSFPEPLPPAEHQQNISTRRYHPYQGRKAWGHRSYSEAIKQAIESSPRKGMAVQEIYRWFCNNVPELTGQHHCPASTYWKAAIRHTLSRRKQFVRVLQLDGRRGLWTTVNHPLGHVSTIKRHSLDVVLENDSRQDQTVPAGPVYSYSEGLNTLSLYHNNMVPLLAMKNNIVPENNGSALSAFRPFVAPANESVNQGTLSTETQPQPLQGKHNMAVRIGPSSDESQDHMVPHISKYHHIKDPRDKLPSFVYRYPQHAIVNPTAGAMRNIAVTRDEPQAMSRYNMGPPIQYQHIMAPKGTFPSQAPSVNEPFSSIGQGSVGTESRPRPLLTARTGPSAEFQNHMVAHSTQYRHIISPQDKPPSVVVSARVGAMSNIAGITNGASAVPHYNTLPPIQYQYIMGPQYKSPSIMYRYNPDTILSPRVGSMSNIAGTRDEPPAVPRCNIVPLIQYQHIMGPQDKTPSLVYRYSPDAIVSPRVGSISNIAGTSDEPPAAGSYNMVLQTQHQHISIPK